MKLPLLHFPASLLSASTLAKFFFMGCLIAPALSFAQPTAQAPPRGQVATPKTYMQSTSATDHAAAPVSLRDSALARSRTPQEVLSGTAQLIGRYNPQSKLRLTLGLNTPKHAEEEKFLADIQDRKSPNFHKYLTPAQWNARFAPSAKDEQAVVDWATNNGMTVTKRYPNRLVVDVEGASEVIEKAFAVQLNSYRVNALTEYSNDRDPVIPAHLVSILGSVGGLNSIQRAHAPKEGNIREQTVDYSPGAVATAATPQHGDGNHALFEAAMKVSQEKLAASSQLKSEAISTRPTPDMTSGYIDPTDIYSSYGYDYGALQAQGHCCNPTNDSGGATPTTSIAIATSGDFADSDFNGFQARYNYLAWYYNRVYIDGTPACCNGETTLDLEWAVATANSFGSYLQTSRVWVYEGADNKLSTFTDVYNQMLSDGHARIFTTSWGCAELSCSGSSSMNTDHNIFNAMLGQGWTILALSHDYGATGGCDAALRVSYPASDPDAIAVGGTALALYNDGSFYSETAWQGGTGAGSCAGNNGGSGGGCSNYYAAPGFQTSAPYCGAGSRSVPDISLNAAYGQNFYFNGGFGGVGGTSISTPQVAGFMAQENAYLMAIGVGCGTGYAYSCAPMGNANYAIYQEGHNPGYAPHYPFYDITSGCNNNDITALYGLGYYCAGTGYDAVTGWGSFNALQLSWAINTYYAGDFVAPKITFYGPTVSTTSNTWFNSDQLVQWTVADQNNGAYPSAGVAGFSQAWDNYFTDPSSEAHQGVGNSFYSGPQFPNATYGYLYLSWAGQGCHYATVDAWDNTGFSTGNNYYYWICYDTVAPTSTAANSPAANSYGWRNVSTSTTLASADSGGSLASGVTATYYAVDTTACTSGTLGSCAVYGGPIAISTSGYHYIAYFAKDLAGNFSSEGYDYIYIDKIAPVTTATLSGTLASGSTYKSNVQVTLNPTDTLSGVSITKYQLDAGALTTYTAPFTASGLGSHTVKFYSTDYSANTETTKSITFSISAPSTTVLTATPNPAANGLTITLTATVTASLGGIPTGTVTFKNGVTTLGTGTIAAGIAKLNITTLPFGSNTLTATYGGTTNVLGSVSAGYVEVFKQVTKTTLASSLNPSKYGQTVTFTATVVPSVSGTVTGSMYFFKGASLLATVPVLSNKATYATKTLAVGSNGMSVIYSGDSKYVKSSSSTLNQIVAKAATTSTVTSSLNPSKFGQSVTLTAKVVSTTAGVPTGTVTFKDGATSLGTKTLVAGVATLPITTLTVANHSITVVYSGDASFLTSTSVALIQRVNAAVTTTTLKTSLTPATHGTAVTFTATVTAATGPKATGTVTFKDGATAIGTGTLNASGIATLSTSSLTVATHSITAVYAGSVSDLASASAALSEVIN